MPQLSSSLRSGGSLVGLGILIMSCGPVVPSPSPSTPVVHPSPVVTAPPSLAPTPIPTLTPAPVTYLSFEELKEGGLEDEGATLICDADPDQLDINAGQTLASCYDGLLVGLRALHTAGGTSFDRLYLQRQTCASSPCSADELNTVTVTGWVDAVATSVMLDFDHRLAAVPAPDPPALWPTPTSSVSPSVMRPVVSGAPASVRKRAPYPFCGRADQDRDQAMGCFLDAILRGTPAEMLDTFDVSGGTEIFRFDGHGPVIRFAELPDGWFQDLGSINLGGWSFDELAGRTPLS